MEYSPYHRIDYLDELATVDDVYDRAVKTDVSDLAAWLRSHQDRPLLAVGAGGSLAPAQMAAYLHHKATGRLGRAGEPMDLFHRSAAWRDTAGLLVTASGSHSDSLAACQHLAESGGDWGVFAGKEHSPGADLLAGSGVPVFGYDLLPEVHCWISVTALLGQTVVLARAFAEAYPQLGHVPSTFADVLPAGADGVDDAVGSLEREFGAALTRRRLAFLYGPDTRSAALDLDSKFAESDLGWLTLHEYRNFAHGRYQMLLPELAEHGVLAFVSQSEQAIAEATFKEIPAPIASATMRLPELTPAGEQVAAIAHLLMLVGALGRVRGLHPGWGSKGTFGDVLYQFELARFFPADAHDQRG